MIAYFNGQYLPKDEVRISPDDRGFLFADGIYEVLRLYSGRPFEAAAHFERLEQGLEELRIPALSREELEEIATNLVRENDLGEADGVVLYFQVTRGAAPRRHAFPEGARPTVYAVPQHLAPAADRERNQEQGVAVILVPDQRWGRCDIKSISLLPNVLANQQAREKGAAEALFVRDGVITEGSHTSVAALLGDHLITHPADHRILPSITRAVVLGLAREADIPVNEHPFTVSELERAEELLLIGTTYEVTPIVTVDDRPIGDGKPGPVTRRLQEAFRERIASFRKNGAVKARPVHSKLR